MKSQEVIFQKSQNCLPSWLGDKSQYCGYITRHWNWMNSYWMIWIGCLRGACLVSSFCDFWNIIFCDCTTFFSSLTQSNLWFFHIFLLFDTVKPLRSKVAFSPHAHLSFPFFLKVQIIFASSEFVNAGFYWIIRIPILMRIIAENIGCHNIAIQHLYITEKHYNYFDLLSSNNETT